MIPRRVLRTVPLLLTALLTALLPIRAPGAASPLPPVASGFDLRSGAARMKHPAAAFRCPTAPPAVTDMSGYVSRYDPKDPTQSKVDPARAAMGAERQKRLDLFAGQLARTGDAAMLGDPVIARCVWHQLASWAREDALLGQVDQNDGLGRHQAIMMQAWQLVTYAAVALRTAPPAPGEPQPDREQALAWMRRLAESVMAEHREGTEWNRHGANLLYWAGISVALTAALLDDLAMKAFALRALDRGLDDVDEAGALRKEMRRGPKSALYQQFAVLPLTMLLRFALANGAAPDARRRDALLRMVRFSAELAQDTGKAAAISGVAQTPLGDKQAFAWIDIVQPAVKDMDPATSALLEEAARRLNLRPSWHIYAGGTVTAAYNPTALAAPER